MNADPGLRADVADLLQHLGRDFAGMSVEELLVYSVALSTRATMRAVDVLIEIREGVRDISGSDA